FLCIFLFYGNFSAENDMVYPGVFPPLHEGTFRFQGFKRQGSGEATGGIKIFVISAFKFRNGIDTDR
ncbi:MAG: hypothetical protein IKX19_07910, partial [Clostridia bacterium]|nr:hypothetical protein [Clostridia bacterium]